MSLRPIARAAAGALLVFTAALIPTPAPSAPIAAPRTGSANAAGEVVRWCLAYGLESFSACTAMCRAAEIDIIVMEGSRFGLPTYNHMRCSVLLESVDEKEN